MSTFPMTSLDEGGAQAVTLLQQAQATRTPCGPVRGLLPDADLLAAYAIQRKVIADRLAGGAERIGRKIGLTNPKVQSQLGVDQPDFGVLLNDMQCRQADEIDIRRLLQPKIEAELAFVLASDLDQPGTIGDAEVAAATAYVVAALEIVDSRIAGWDITIVDTVADNASSGLFVLGDSRVPLGDIDPSSVSMVLQRGQEEVSVGRGEDCLGSPLRAVAWLANLARDLGDPLRAGEVILSGALGPMTPVLPGAAYRADITGVGTVSARFSTATATERANAGDAAVGCSR